MKIIVGSKNQTKLDAVKDTVKLYPELFPHPEVVGLDAGVELFGHPKSLAETIQGAIIRSKAVFKNCAYSFGLEGGLLEVPGSKSGYMEVSVCAVYDGRNFHLGLSPAFEWPKRVTDLIINGKADASQAFKQLEFTAHDKLGASKGGITGFLTHGRLTREDCIKHSIIMALIQLERPEWY